MAVDSWAVQRAVFAKLQPDLAAMTPPVALVDHAPDKLPMPLVEIGRFVQMPDNYLARDATRYRVTFTVWSDKRGQREVQQILDVIRAALDDADITLDAGTCVRCDMESADTSRDADGKTYMGSAIYALLVEH